MDKINKKAQKGSKNQESSIGPILKSQDSHLIEKRHQQIVEGACKVLFQKGYHPTTTREIAKACGMSIGQLYHYISSKDDVLYLVHKHSQKIWYNYLMNCDLEKINDPMERIKKALYESLQFMIDNKKLIQFIYSETKYLDKKHLSVVLEMDSNNVVGFWRKLLSGLKETRPVKGDLDFLSSVIAYLLAFLALRGWTLKEKPKDELLDSLVGFILRGIGVA